ncbi:Carbohydrate esterase family 5 protein [Mycena kentingensis (nom. inval.)]|nr:Carbohydrate esterase family 5 protein [Mycena kentingensis (nom. inval.)]
MKAFFTTFVLAPLALGAPARRALTDTVSDMDALIDGDAAGLGCADTAVIFARGTFDSGNIGVWVGPQFEAALRERIQNVAFQGVDPSAYLADLQGYLGESGSDAGAQALADTVEAYARICPDTTHVISGWSQGALVAHKGLGLLSPETQARVKGLVTFGDPAQLFADDLPAMPSSVQVNSQCFTRSVPDPLCAPKGSFEIPTSISDVIAPFSELPSLAVGAQEAAAAASLVAAFPGQLLAAKAAFAQTLLTNPKRVLLTPEHFMYGNKGLTEDAADFVASL